MNNHIEEDYSIAQAPDPQNNTVNDYVTKAELDRAVLEARAELFNLYGTPICSNLHHPKKYQHGSLDDCPVVDRIVALQEQLKELERKRG